jgi:hypothetical protein
MTPLATEDDPMSTSICIIQKITLKVYFFYRCNLLDNMKMPDKLYVY